jgi:hypothetical protein
MMPDGFLNRWSRRKAGKLDEPLAESDKVDSAPKVVTQDEPEPLPPATLEDVEKIDRFDPDFSAFMKPDVDPAVQQAALKKMFTDPHFNVMDGLDIYIDDYSKPDPLPEGMLQRMVQSDMLKLFQKTTDDTARPDSSIANSAPDQEKPVVLPASAQTDLTSSDSATQSSKDQVGGLAEDLAKKNNT